MTKATGPPDLRTELYNATRQEYIYIWNDAMHFIFILKAALSIYALSHM